MKTTVLGWLAVLAVISASYANATVINFGAQLAPEVLGATGSGTVLIAYDDVPNTLAITANWSGLSGTTLVAHIHCCTATAGVGTVGVAVTPGTLPGFPVGTSAGAYTVTIDLDDPSVFTAGFITNFAEEARRTPTMHCLPASTVERLISISIPLHFRVARSEVS